MEHAEQQSKYSIQISSAIDFSSEQHYFVLFVLLDRAMMAVWVNAKYAISI